MRALYFAKRTAKEILRDPMTVGFGLGFPLVLLFLLSAIQANIPVELFEISSLAPGIAVFGLTFMALFSAQLISKDRESAFLQMLFTTPMTAADFILGYILPMLPIALMQSIICYGAALALGLDFSPWVIAAVVMSLPSGVLFIALGVLFGSVLTVKQVGGICGALLTNVTAWLSGIWFDLDLVGGVFSRIANCLPFVHGVEGCRAVLAGDMAGAIEHIAVVMCYAVVILCIGIWCFTRKMKN